MKFATKFFALIALVWVNAVIAQPREGFDYTRLKQAQPVSTSADQIEVLEAFSYACGGCAGFEPSIQAWKARAPVQVKFVRIPMAWNSLWEVFARAYYASEALGVLEKTHTPLFDALFKQNKKMSTAEDLSSFYANYGVKPADFLKVAKSFGVNSKIARSKLLAPRYEIDGTPTIIVAGKYRIVSDTQKKIGFPEVIKTLDFLVQKELLERKAVQAPVVPATIAAPVKK